MSITLDIYNDPINYNYVSLVGKFPVPFERIYSSTSHMLYKGDKQNYKFIIK